MLSKKSVAIGPVSVLLCCQMAMAQMPQPAPVAFTINVVQGNGAVNFINQKPVRVPVVKVEDAAGRAVRGATVQFQAPVSGPGATFKGALTYAAVTGPDGTAKAAGFVPNGQAGQFMVRVVAEYEGQTVEQQMTQNNVAPPAAAPHHHKLLLKVAAGCAAVGLFSFLVYGEFVAKNKPYGQR